MTTPLTLTLIRHAKSDWSDDSLADHDRPLNPRGREAAPRIGKWLAAHGQIPDLSLCSSAKRTLDTWALIAAELGQTPPPTEIMPALYLAMPHDLLGAIRTQTARKLALISHNPGIGALARALANTPPDHPKFTTFPTGATLILQFDAAHWADIHTGSGQVLAFTTPRDLPETQKGKG